MEQKRLYSKHIFLFPFRWDYKSAFDSIDLTPLKKRIDIPFFVNNLMGCWKPSMYYKNNPISYYNDASFFYEYVRTAIYSENAVVDKNTVLNFEYSDLNENESTYTIEIEQYGNPYCYKLNLNRLSLNVYETGIGILAFHLNNYLHVESEDVLRINDFGRRIYPQFLDTGSSKETEGQDIITAVRNAFLPKCITVTANKEVILREDFSLFNDALTLKENIANNPRRLPNAPNSIAKMLGDKFNIYNHLSENDEIIIRSILDDRMFTVCWYSDKKEIEKLAEWDDAEKEYGYSQHTKNNFWTKFIFIDNSDNTIQSRHLRKKISIDHTYDRWIDYKTLYGISRYSLTCLVGDEPFQLNFLPYHVCGRYYEMAQLALAQRASILKFSDEATLIANKAETDIINEAEELHRMYMRFVNRLYFREVTAQEQGIELYQIIATNMELERDVEKLNREIDELHQFTGSIEEAKQTKYANRLSQVAMWFLPASIVLSIFGLTNFPKFDFQNGVFWIWDVALPVIICIAASLAFTLLYYRRNKK